VSVTNEYEPQCGKQIQKTCVKYLHSPSVFVLLCGLLGSQLSQLLCLVFPQVLLLSLLPSVRHLMFIFLFRLFFNFMSKTFRTLENVFIVNRNLLFHIEK
jgi:hypothetical protein